MFGKIGLSQSALLPTELDASALLRDAAARIHAPVLTHAQWDDELFPHQGALDLFDAFASLDKTFVARPGSHSTSDDDDEPGGRPL